MQKVIQLFILTGWTLICSIDLNSQVVLSIEADQALKAMFEDRLGSSNFNEIEVVVFPIQLDCRGVLFDQNLLERPKSRTINLVNAGSLHSELPPWIRRNSIYLKSTELLELGL
jgi:hypothetical protein